MNVPDISSKPRQLWIFIVCMICMYSVFFSRHFAVVVLTSSTTTTTSSLAVVNSTNTTANQHSIHNTNNATTSSSITSTNSGSSTILNHTLDYQSCTNNSILPENWCYDTNRIPRYIGTTTRSVEQGAGHHNHTTNETQSPPLPPPPEMIQHYTHEGYDKCLGNKTVVFIGDSRVRYQFMHLARYLNSKKPMRCQDYKGLVVPTNLQSLRNWTDDNTTEPTHWYDSGFTLPQPECYLIDEKIGPHDWNSWYKMSTIMLDSNHSSSSSSSNHHQSNKSLSTGATALEKQSSLCDCFRPGHFVPKLTYENRFIQRSTVHGTANLIYLQNFQNYIRMNEQFPPYYSSFDPPRINATTTTEERCNVGECSNGNRKNVFQGDLKDTLWKILPRLNTTHAFVNLGWEHLYPMEAQSDFSCVIQDFERHHPEIKVYLISHPPDTTKISNPLESFDVTKLKCDIKVLDRTSMSKNVPLSWYWDSVHVLSILNEEYNHQLVEKICPLEDSKHVR